MTKRGSQNTEARMSNSPKPMVDMKSRLDAMVAEGQARCQDPTYQANVAEREAKEARENEAMRAAYRRERLERSGVPRLLWDELHRSNVTDCTSRVSAFMCSTDTILVLSGLPGCGKTFAACTAIDSEGGRFAKVAAVVSKPFDRAYQDDLADAKLLVLDDLGAEWVDGKQFSRAVLWNLLERRRDEAKKTILTTNLDRDGFRATYGSEAGRRLLSRMNEGGQFYVSAAKDMRGQR